MSSKLSKRFWQIKNAPSVTYDIDCIMSMCADKGGVNVGQSLFTDTYYTDDAVLFAEDEAQWTSILLELLYTRNSQEDRLSLIHYVPAGPCLEAESAE